LKPVPIGDDKQIASLIADLDSDKFPTRQRAARELDRLGESVLGACEAALAGNPSAEARRRLEALQGKYTDQGRNPTPERLRALRALEVLELCGSTEARAVLRVLAQGARGAALTQHAKAALDRLTRVP
jgi:hypothetical protein